MIGRRVAMVIAAGAVVKLVLAFATYGNLFDITSLHVVSDRLHGPHPLHLYEGLQAGRWPYPAGYFPFVYLAGALGTPFDGWIQVVPIIAECGIAWLVADELRRRCAPEVWQIAGAALVSFGPMFILIDGYHGQIDAVPTLFALGATLLLARDGRPWLVGLLLGLAVSMKTAPVLLLLILVPAVPTWRGRAELAALAVAIPLLVSAPWLLTDFHAARENITGNAGVPSLGGYSVLLQPGLTHAFLFGDSVRPSGAITWFTDHQNLIVGIGALAAAVVARVRRMPVVAGAALLYLAVWTFNPNAAYQYYLWGIPFLAIAGYFRATAALQLVLAVPAIIIYGRFGDRWLAPPYIVLLIAIWAAIAATWLTAMRRGLSERTW